MTSNGTLIVTALTIEQINAALFAIADRLKKNEDRLKKNEDRLDKLEEQSE